MGASVSMLAGGVEPALGGALLAPLGHDAGGVGAMRERDRQHLLGRRHLEVERQRDLGAQARDVVVGDVAAILAQMRGDAVGAGGRPRSRRRAADRDGRRRARCGSVAT